MCLILCDPRDCSMPGFPVLHHLTKLQTHESEILFNYLILCYPLLLLPSIFPSIRVFSNESVLHIRWLKYWSLSLSISPSSEYSGLISLVLNLVNSWPERICTQPWEKGPWEMLCRSCSSRNSGVGQAATIQVFPRLSLGQGRC